MIIQSFNREYLTFWHERKYIPENDTNQRLSKEIAKRCLSFRIDSGYYFKVLFDWMRRTNKDHKKYNLGFYAGQIALSIFLQNRNKVGDTDYEVITREVENTIKHVASLRPPITRQSIINSLSPYYLAMDPEFDISLFWYCNASKLIAIRNARIHLDQHPVLKTTIKKYWDCPVKV